MPSQIFASVTGGFGLNTRNKCGPFQSPFNLSTFFTVVVDHQNFLLKVFVSVNDGVTWTEADAANNIALNHTTNKRIIASLASGNTIYIAFIHTDLTIRIATFDMVLSKWSTIHTGGPTLPTLAAIQPCIDIARRSNGDLIVMVQGQEVVGILYSRTEWTKFSGGVWSALNQIGTGVAADRGFAISLMASQDRIHIFMFEGEAGGVSTNILKHVTLKSDDTLGTIQTASGALGASLPDPPGEYKGVYSSGKNLITQPFIDGSPGILAVTEAIDADDPVWTITDIGGPIPLNNFGYFLNAALDSIGNAYIFFSDFLSAGASNATGILQVNNVGGVWNDLTNPVVVYGVYDDLNVGFGQVVFSVSAALTKEGIAIAFDENPTNGAATTPTQLSFLLTKYGQSINVLLDQQRSFVLGFPSVRSCCLLCEQPEWTGLPLPIVRDKSLTYRRGQLNASVNTSDQCGEPEQSCDRQPTDTQRG